MKITLYVSLAVATTRALRLLSFATVRAVALGVSLALGASGSAIAQLASPDPASASPVPSSDNEVVVIGTRSQRTLKDSPVPVRVVDRKEIEAAGDLTAADSLTRVVGVHIDTAIRTGQTPQIQGFSSKHVLVLIDGRRATGRLADDFDLARIPASSIERIEVLKGASSVLYGSDAIGGVINIITKRPRPGLQGSARVSRDSLHRDDASVSISGGNETVTARLDGGYQQAPAYDLKKDDAATSSSGYDRYNGQLEVAVQATESLQLSTTLTSEDGKADAVAISEREGVIDRDIKSRGRSARVGAQYRPDATAEVRLDLGDSRRVYGLVENQRANGQLVRRAASTEVARDAGLIGSLAYAERHETVTGLEVSKQEFFTNQMTGMKERLRTGAFVQHEWRALDSLTLVPGIRYDRDEQFGDNVSKAFTVRVDPTSQTVLRLSYGEGFRAPSFSELYLDFYNPGANYRVSGNPDLRPERSRSLQASLAWQPSADLWMSVGVFDNRVHDLVTSLRTQPDGVLLVNYANTESVRNRGAETSVRARYFQRLVLGLDYTFLEARDESRTRTLEGRPMHAGGVQARYESAGGFSSALVMNLVAKRPFYTEARGVTTTQWAKAYRSTTLRFAQKLGDFEVFTGVRNLSNETQEVLHPVAPRSYFGGVGAEL